MVVWFIELFFLPLVAGILCSTAYVSPSDPTSVSPFYRGLFSGMRVISAALFLFVVLNSPLPRSILMVTLFVLVVVGTFLVRRRF
ncbi:TPA: hypothetical protein DDZ86_02565 [Candidatus Dependentiae bacterium]|nr:MAG: hypothetical protein UW09_C0001G0135 [candidate division TM6 bacterium GW2011_GWF2_43_87]HBL98502.1 hypothetical protein [Candidatus Dependentiae bacterium]